MINTATICELKEKYNKHTIHYIVLDGIDFVYRSLIKKEYVIAVELHNRSVVGAQEYVADIAIIYNKDKISEVSPGCLIKVSELILQASGFTASEKSLEEKITKYRDNLGFLTEQAVALICHVFNYKFEDLDYFTHDQLLQGLMMAEYVLSMNPTYGEFKLNFSWETEKGNIPNSPNPTTHNQKKMAVSMEQLQETSTNNAKSALNKTLKETNGQVPKKTFDWQNDI